MLPCGDSNSDLAETVYSIEVSHVSNVEAKQSSEAFGAGNTTKRIDSLRGRGGGGQSCYPAQRRVYWRDSPQPSRSASTGGTAAPDLVDL